VKQLLIVGSMRSGTTLLNRLLGAHPQIGMIYHPTRFFESRKDLRDLGVAGFLEKFRSQWGFFGHLSQEARARCEQALGALPEDAPKGDIYSTLTTGLVDKPGMQVVGEKYAGRGAEMLPFHEVLPDGKVIMIVRDPRDVLLSNKKRIEQEADMDSYWAGAHLMALDDWASLAVRHRSFDQIQGGTYLQLRYEDLVRAPEETVKGICDFLGVPFAPEILQSGAMRHEDGREWKANTSHGEQYTSISAKSVGAYQGGLSAGEILCLNALLAEHLRFFGYPLDPMRGEVAVLAEACNLFLDLGRTLKRYNIADARLYNLGGSEDDNLAWFLDKLVALGGIDQAEFARGFLVGRAVTARSAGAWMETVSRVLADEVKGVATEVVALRRSFEYLPASLHDQSESVSRELRNVRAAVDRFPSPLNVVKRLIRKPPA
jgi:hypothetical protein